MELNGLNDKQARGITQWLDAAEDFRVKSEAHHLRKTYSDFLLFVQEELEKYLKEKDFLKILDVEKLCQQHDAEFLHLDREKSAKCMANLNHLTALYMEGMDEEKVRNKYVPVMEDLKAQGTRPRDSAFEAGIRAQSRIIGECIGQRSNFAEKSLYETRQKCLLSLKQEHQRNLDRAMGYEKKKSHSKEKDQEISR